MTRLARGGCWTASGRITQPAASKLNRDPRFIQDLIAHGEQRAGEFAAALAFERAWGLAAGVRMDLTR